LKTIENFSSNSFIFDHQKAQNLRYRNSFGFFDQVARDGVGMEKEEGKQQAKQRWQACDGAGGSQPLQVSNFS